MVAGGLALTVLGARGNELGVAGGAVLLVVGVVLAIAVAGRPARRRWPAGCRSPGGWPSATPPATAPGPPRRSPP